MAGEQEDKAGDDGNGNIAEQHDRLRFYQELYVLNAHQEVQNQQDRCAADNGPNTQVQVKRFIYPSHNCHYNCRRNRDPSCHD